MAPGTPMLTTTPFCCPTAVVGERDADSQCSTEFALVNHIVIEAPTKSAVDAFFSAALRAGGTSHWKPFWTEQSIIYAAAVFDLDDHLVEVIYRRPESCTASTMSVSRSSTSHGGHPRSLRRRDSLSRAPLQVIVNNIDIRNNHYHSAPRSPSATDSHLAKSLSGLALAAATGAALSYAFGRLRSTDARHSAPPTPAHESRGTYYDYEGPRTALPYDPSTTRYSPRYPALEGPRSASSTHRRASTAHYRALEAAPSSRPSVSMSGTSTSRRSRSFSHSHLAIEAAPRSHQSSLSSRHSRRYITGPASASRFTYASGSSDSSSSSEPTIVPAHFPLPPSTLASRRSSHPSRAPAVPDRRSSAYTVHRETRHVSHRSQRASRSTAHRRRRGGREWDGDEDGEDDDDDDGVDAASLAPSDSISQVGSRDERSGWRGSAVTVPRYASRRRRTWID